jgi:hypothetical protein
MSKTETTSVSMARPNSESLRATIPRGISVFLGLNSGDQIEWEIVIGQKGERLAMVKKVNHK